MQCVGYRAGRRGGLSDVWLTKSLDGLSLVSRSNLIFVSFRPGTFRKRDIAHFVLAGCRLDTAVALEAMDSAYLCGNISPSRPWRERVAARTMEEVGGGGGGGSVESRTAKG